MRVEEVRLRNFRSYGNNTTSLRFAPGLNVILGRIGSGKSSVLEAILVCLFGFSKSGIRKSDVLRKDATSESLQLELSFFLDDMHFKISRGNETRLESSPDGMSWTLISESSPEIDSFIESTLEVSARKFRDLFYAAQGELTNVITGSPEERQKSIDKLVGAEGLRETYEHLGEHGKFYDKDIGSAEGKLSDIDAYLKRHDLDAMRDKKREAEGETIEIGESISRVSAEIEGLSAKLKEAMERARPLEEASSRYEAIREEIGRKDSELAKERFIVEQCEGQLAGLAGEERENRGKLAELGPRREEALTGLKERESRLESLSVMKAEASGLAAQRDRAARNVESLKREIEKERASASETGSRIKEAEAAAARIHAEIEEGEAGLAEASRAMEDGSRELTALEEACNRAAMDLDRVREKAKENAEKITRLNSLSSGAQCPFCEQPITAAHRAKVVDAIETAIRQLLAEEKAALASSERAREELEAVRRDLDAKGKALQRLQHGLGELKAAEAREDQKRENLARNLEQSESRRSKSEESLGEEARHLEQLVARIEEARAASGIVSGDWVAGLDRAVEEAREERRRAQETASGLESEFRTAEKMLRRAAEESRKQAEKMEEANRTVGRLEDEIAHGRAEMKAIVEPVLGDVEDPGARLSEIIAGVQSEIQGLKDRKGEKEIEKVRLSSDYRQREEQASQLAREIEEYIGEQERRRQVKRTHTVYSEARNLLQQVRDRYKDAREMVRTNLINVLKETLRIEFDKLYTYEDFHELMISDSYDVSLRGPVGEIQAHNLSAGQKAITAIAFRLAVAKAMQMKIGCWIIDEPTQNIGKAEVDALADVLADTTEIPQIVIATHHEALGRNGHVVSLELRGGETLLGEGMEPLGVSLLPQSGVQPAK